MIQTCSLCNWFSVNTDDVLCDAIKKRHEEKHMKHETHSERTGSKISQNNIIGVVEWL